MMWQWGDGVWTWGMALWGLMMMALFWGALVAIIVIAVRAARLPGSAVALDIAKRRYASGEISREQFEQIRRDISG